MESNTAATGTHIPRPITPEDNDYRDVMMVFSDEPVKPKYWFEDFGDYWSCSCGQINRGDTCSNCGLERELLRRIFVLHKPAAGEDSGIGNARIGNTEIGNSGIGDAKGKSTAGGKVSSGSPNASGQAGADHAEAGRSGADRSEDAGSDAGGSDAGQERKSDTINMSSHGSDADGKGPGGTIDLGKAKKRLAGKDSAAASGKGQDPAPSDGDSHGKIPGDQAPFRDGQTVVASDELRSGLAAAVRQDDAGSGHAKDGAASGVRGIAEAKYRNSTEPKKSKANKPEAAPEPTGEDEENYIRRKRRARGIVIFLTVLIFLLGGGLAGFYYVALPELQQNSEIRVNAAKDSVAHALPAGLYSLDDIHFRMLVNLGDTHVEGKKYEEAIDLFERALKLREDRSVRNRLLAAKYAFVVDHQENGGADFNKYLDELYEKNYPGIQKIYEQQFSWTASAIVNTSANDEDTDLESTGRANPIYFHNTVSGGPPDDSIDLYYEIIWPNGSSERKDVPSSKASGETVTIRCQYNSPAENDGGRLTFKLFNNDTHEMLVTDSILLK